MEGRSVRSSEKYASSLKIGILSGALFVRADMLSSQKQKAVKRSELHANYRVAWLRFAGEVHRWHDLQKEEQADLVRLCEAETAAHAAEEQYRQARNLFADHLLEHSCREWEPLLVGSR